MDDTSGNLPPGKTVCFNVGGTKYTVAYSTIEKHPKSMLAKLACKQGGEEVFIDRSGSRFGYVLDYIRDGKATIPSSCPLESLMQDLTFFGFEKIPPGVIQVSASADNLEAGALFFDRMKQKGDEAKTKTKELADQILKLERQKDFTEMAFCCFSQYCRMSSSKCQQDQITVTGREEGFEQGWCRKYYNLNVPNEMAEFNEYLLQYGLSLVSSVTAYEKSGGVKTNYLSLRVAPADHDAKNGKD